MKKILIAILLLNFLMILYPQSAVIISKSGLRMRDQPSLKGNKIGVIPFEKVVKILDSDDKKVEIITNNAPLVPYIIIIVLIIILLISAYYCYKRKQKLFYLKILAFSLIIMSLLLPWWSINCVQTSDGLSRCSRLARWKKR